jgi:peptide/nickel transport system permease protein
VITLEFGLTLSGEKVSEHILKRLEPTFILAVFSVMFGGGFGVFFALYSVYSKSKFIEIIFHTFSRFILSIPIFVIGVSCFLLFSIFISIFPPGGYERGNILFLVLPGFSLGSRVFARIYFFAFESSKIEESSTYIFHLRARGFGERKIVFKYIFYKIFPILLILLLIDLGSLLSGAMIVEEIFSFPGIGKSTYFAIKNMDANLLSALLFYSGLLFYTLNSLAKYLQSKISGAASS